MIAHSASDLTGDRSTSCAEGNADRDLAPAGHASCEQHRAEIRARDEQYGAHREEHDLPRVEKQSFWNCQPVKDIIRNAVGSLGATAAFKPLASTAFSSFGSRFGHARAQTNKGVRAERLRQTVADERALRQPHIVGGKVHSPRHHTDDVVVAAADGESEAALGAVAREQPKPELIADDDHRQSSVRRIGGVERPANCGTNSENAKQRGRDRSRQRCPRSCCRTGCSSA